MNNEICVITSLVPIPFFSHPKQLEFNNAQNL